MRVVRHSLEEIAAPFTERRAQEFMTLTPTEVRICDLIRRPLPSRESTKLQCIAPATVDRHREHIRRKLGITNKRVNLPTFLDSFMTAPRKTS